MPVVNPFTNPSVQKKWFLLCLGWLQMFYLLWHAESPLQFCFALMLSVATFQVTLQYKKELDEMYNNKIQ